MKQIITLVAASLVLAAGPAMAEEESQDEGFFGKSLDWLSTDTYIGVQFGSASADVSESELASSLTTANIVTRTSIDDGGTAYRIFFGKRFHQHFSAEIGFADLGDIDVGVDATANDTAAYFQQLADNAPVAPAGVVLDAVGDWRLADLGVDGEWGSDLSVYGRLGLFIWETEIEYSNLGMTYTGSDDGVDLHFGLGASYRINENFDVRLEFESYQSTTSVDMFGLGVAYHF